MFNINLFLEKYLASPDEKFVLACSTWQDSIFLLHQIIESKYKNNMIACYLNHHFRKEADEEETFLKGLGEKHGFTVEIWQADIKEIQKSSKSISLEELSRKERYDFLENVRKKYNAHYILTAHHLDDKIETFFFNLMRGSKLTGLINMTERSGNILRPLLHLEKQEIANYLQEKQIEYRTDSTNFDTTITRNNLRENIIPLFQKINPKCKKNIENTLSYFEELKANIDLQINDFFTACHSELVEESFGGNYDADKEKSKKPTPNKSTLNFTENNFFYVDAFLNLSPFLQKEIIRFIFSKTNDNSTIWLSEANINEVLKFIKNKGNFTKKEIKKMGLTKRNNIVRFASISQK